MKWLNSLDELLYEIMSWLLFFPITLWRATSRPVSTMREIEREAALPDDQRYGAVLSPPLFLALALLLGHAVATALGQTDKIIASHHGLADLINDNASALVLRVIVFAAFPLFLAARLVRRQGVKLNRASLQLPFYEQCYPAAVFALGVRHRHQSRHRPASNRAPDRPLARCGRRPELLAGRYPLVRGCARCRRGASRR